MYTNKEDDIKWHRKYYKKNRKILLEKKKKYYLENVEKIALRDKKYNSKHKAEKSEYNKKYNILNRNKRIKHQRKYYKENYKEIKDRQKGWYTQHPWSRTYNCIETRVKSSLYYIKKGIKNNLNFEQLKELWFRDKAYKMKKPSIHRINNDGDYSIENCKYVELGKHISMHKRGEM